MNDETRRDPGYDERVDDDLTRTEDLGRADELTRTEDLGRADELTRTVVVASFRDRATAEGAVERLRETGYGREEIGFASREETDAQVQVEAEEITNTAGPGAFGGAVTGAVSGGTLAWLGLAALPAIGPFLAAGAVGTALLAAGAGAVTGGVLGGLLGLGIPRHKAEYHQQQLEQGLSLVTVRTGEPLVVERLLSDAGAVEVDRATDAQPIDEPQADVSAGDDEVLVDPDR